MNARSRGKEYLEGQVSGKQLSRRSNDIDTVKLDALARRRSGRRVRALQATTLLQPV